MIQSQNDQKQYRQITLSNKLSVLLISDPTTEKSAASLAVNVGHFDDPQASQGLAHLLEHMLFLGTKNYPDPDEYQTFIKNHGGQNNAWTSSEFTNFFFSIQNTHFTQGLERFSDFFINPLMDHEWINKELSAVESEYKLKLTDENRRVLAVLKETVNPEHPFSKFSVGNKQTLKDDATSSLGDKVNLFYQTKYCASKMKVVLYNNATLDQMEALAKIYFKPIINQGLTTNFPQIDLLLEHQKNIAISITSLKDIKKLTLNFSMPKTADCYQSKPLSYIAYLLGYEGTGSLLSLLKAKGLANHLSAGSGINGYNYLEFSIVIALTNEGLEKIDLIIKHVFSFVRLIKVQGVDCWRYSEKHNIIKAAFDFQEKAKPMDLVSHLVINMFKYHSDDIIYGDFAMANFEPDLILECLNAIVPSNLRLITMAPNFSGDCLAKWYDTPYQVAPITPSDHLKWQACSNDIDLPRPNPFIVERLSFQDNHSQCAIPKVLQDKLGLRLWHYRDNEFKVPRGHIYTAIDSPHVGKNARTVALCHLYVEMLHDNLAEMTYPAEVAGLHYDIYPHQAGLTMHVSGYTPKLFLFFEMLITQIQQRNFCNSRFDEIKQQLTTTLLNSKKDKPINQLFKGLGSVLQPNQYPSQLLLAELSSVSLDELHQFIKSLYRKVHLECYVQGDWEKKEVETLGHGIHQQISAIASPHPAIKRQLIDINNRGTLIREFDCGSEDSAIIVYLQSSLVDKKKVALFSMLNHICSAHFFADIRTKQQLGYLCGTSYMPINRHPGMILYIQSNVEGPDYLVNAVDTFFSTFISYLEQLSTSDWEKARQGLLSQIKTPDHSARSRAHRFWLSIGNRDYQFNHRSHIASAVESLTKQQLIEFVTLKITAQHKDRLVLCTYSKKNPKQRFTRGHGIRELDLFKQQAKKFTL